MKQSINVLNYARRLLDVNAAGFTKCLFHKDKTASMKIYKDGFYCFGCNKSGDIYDLIQKINNVNFIEAKKILENEYGKPSDDQINKARRLQAKMRKEKKYKDRLYEDWAKANGTAINLCPIQGDEGEILVNDKWIKAVENKRQLELEMLMNDVSY